MSNLKGIELETLTDNQIYEILIKGTKTILIRKSRIKRDMEYTGQDNSINYAAIVNEISALERAENLFMLFTQ